MIDECHYVSEFGFCLRTELNRIWTNVLKSFAETKNKRPMLLMSASNANESITDAINILRMNIDPNNIFRCPPEHHMKNNIDIYTHCHVANRFFFRKQTQRIIDK